MNRQLKKFGSLVGLVVLSASISVGLAGCPSSTITNSNNAEPIEIDANLPLTGDLAFYGKTIKDGATFAQEDLERSDPNSPKLKFDWQDNLGEPPKTVSVFQNQYLKVPDLYLSGLKPQTDAIRQQVDAKGTPYFVWTFDAFINQNSNNEFRTWLNFKIESPMYLKFVKEKQAKRVAILYVKLVNTEEQFTKLVIPALKKQGIEVFVESYDIKTGNYKDIAAKVRNFNPDVLLLNGFPNNLVGIIRGFRPLGLIKDDNTMGSFDTFDTATILGKEELEGITVATPLFMLNPEQKVAEWNQRFKTRFGRFPVYTDAFSYDMVQIIHDAAKRIENPSTAPSSKWIDALRATNIEGITGPLKFDNEGDLAVPLGFGIYRDGKLINRTSQIVKPN